MREDLDRIAAAAHELIDGRAELRGVRCATTSPRCSRAHGGDAAAIWSIDGVHRAYVGDSPYPRPDSSARGGGPM